MAAQYAYLAVWLVGLFGLVGAFIAGVASFVQRDSWEYDEAFVWRRKLRE